MLMHNWNEAVGYLCSFHWVLRADRGFAQGLEGNHWNCNLRKHVKARSAGHAEETHAVW